MPDPLVRDATADDAAACAAIYAPYVTGTTVTFETDPPDAAEMGRRIAKAQARHAFLVLEEDGAVVGYAYAGPFKERAAYRWSCEVSVYLSPDRHGRGGGRRLYEALLERLTARGYRMAAAGMTQPNEASAPAARGDGLRAGRHLPRHRLEVRCRARRHLGPALPGRPGPRGEDPPEPT